MTDYKTPNGKHVARPLYVIPREYEHQYLDALSRTNNLAKVLDAPLAAPAGATAVLIAPDYLGSLVIEEDEEGLHDLTFDDFRPRYTPTDEEVARALRGPAGPVGPMGMAGAPGASAGPSDDDLADVYERLASTERAVASVMRSVAEIVISITPDPNQNKEQ